MVAAAWSKDPAMVGSFTLPKTIIKEDGTSYPNPYANLHTLTAVKCCSPQLFVGVAEEQWVSLSESNGSRKTGKITNFGKQKDCRIKTCSIAGTD